MGWFEKFIDILQEATVLSEKVETLSSTIIDTSHEIRDINTRVSRIEGYIDATKQSD
jgi:hypothetical protein